MILDVYLYSQDAHVYLPLEDGSVVYEAQRLDDKAAIGTDDYRERWLPISKPLANLDLAMAVIDWVAEANPDFVFRVVKMTIKQEIVWPEAR